MNIRLKQHQIMTDRLNKIKELEELTAYYERRELEKASYQAYREERYEQRKMDKIAEREEYRETNNKDFRIQQSMYNSKEHIKYLRSR